MSKIHGKPEKIIPHSASNKKSWGVGKIKIIANTTILQFAYITESVWSRDLISKKDFGGGFTASTDYPSTRSTLKQFILTTAQSFIRMTFLTLTLRFDFYCHWPRRVSAYVSFMSGFWNWTNQINRKRCDHKIRYLTPRCKSLNIIALLWQNKLGDFFRWILHIRDPLLQNATLSCDLSRKVFTEISRHIKDLRKMCYWVELIVNKDKIRKNNRQAV